jgi:Fungal protein kinase
LPNRTTFYIVSKPFVNNDILPVGRGTRCYEAYDCQTREVVLLKDTWRVEGYLPEGDVYRRLHEAGVSNIAGFIAAGDVDCMSPYSPL